MAGVLYTIAKQLVGRRKNETPAPKVTTSAYDSTVRIRHVAPVVGPEWKTVNNGNPISDTGSPEENAAEKINPENTKAEVLIEDVEHVVQNELNEGKTEVGKDDYLLTQIDEFREKAQQLQDLLLSKESKVMELQNIVDEREGKAKELETILNERKKKADGIAEEMAKEVTAEITAQIDAIIGKVTSKLEEFEHTVSNDLKAGQKLTEQQYAEIKSALDETLPALNTQLETLKTELSEKVHSENVKCYRNVSDLIKSLDDKMDLLKNTEYSIQHKAGVVHRCMIALIVLTVINMIGIAALVAFQLMNFKLF